MKLIKMVFILSLLLLSACTPDYHIDAELRMPVQEVKEMLRDHGIELSPRISFYVDYSRKYTRHNHARKTDTIAVCRWYRDKMSPSFITKEIWIRPDLIDLYSVSNVLRLVLLHEIGHCQFKLDHEGRGSYYIEDSRFSIMNEIINIKKLSSRQNNESYYVYNILFGFTKTSKIYDLINLIPNFFNKEEVNYECDGH